MELNINIKTVILALLLALTSTLCFAQCEKATFTSSKTDHYNAKGEYQRSTDEKAVVTITKDLLVVEPGEDYRMEGKVTSYECNWTVPFKEGKTVVKSTVINPNGNEAHVTITIVGHGGKIDLTFVAEEMPDNVVKVVADKFE